MDLLSVFLLIALQIGIYVGFISECVENRRDRQKNRKLIDDLMQEYDRRIDKLYELLAEIKIQCNPDSGLKLD